MRSGKRRQLVHSSLDFVLLTGADDHIVSMLEELSGKSLADSYAEATAAWLNRGRERTNM